ncbi:MAG: helix-turn-helix domain-containing protein [Egibacteraceae bacterium]
MARGIDIYGTVLRELRDDRGWSAAQLAEHAKAVAKAKGDRQFALDKHQICRYEHNRLRPSLRSLEYMLTALEPSFADLRRLLKPSDPLAVLLELTREAKAEAEIVKAEEDPPMDRREVAIKLPAAVAAYVALPNVGDPLRAEIDEVTGAYATSSPQKLLPQARRVLDEIKRAMREPMTDGVRRRLLVDASEVAAVAGMMALFAGHPGEADAYFTQALKFANESGVDQTRGCVLVSASSLHDPFMGDGDAAAGLAMLQAAEPLIGAGCPTAKTIVILQADFSSALGRYAETMSTLDRADCLRLADDGKGLYSLRGCYAGYDEPRLAGWSGRILARLGRTDEALDPLGRSLAAPHVNIRTSAVLLGDIALAHTKAGQNPEPACQAAIRSLGVSHAVGYTVGVDRVLRVRDMMPPEWTPLACVRELDERLRLPAMGASSS